jgi:hypothetical protein
MRKERRMSRAELLAAEIFGYSFANYHDHLGGNVRYDRLMPDDAKKLDRAHREKWSLARLAAELDTEEENAANLLAGYQRAVAVVDAENPAEAFRNAVRFAIRSAVEDGLSTDADLEKLVAQICYRAADLAYLLDSRGDSLSRYSRHLRRDPDVDYYDGYFDEPDPSSSS